MLTKYVFYYINGVIFLFRLKLDSYCKKLNELVSREINPCGSIADKLEEWYQYVSNFTIEIINLND